MTSRRTHSLGKTRVRSGFAYAPRLDAMEDRMSPGDTGFGMSLAWGFLDSPIVNPIASLETPAHVSRMSTADQGGLSSAAASVQVSTELAQLTNQPLPTHVANVTSGDASAELANPAWYDPDSRRAAPLRINEIRRDQPGTDNDEYFELIGDPGGDLSPYTYIVISDTGANIGILEEITVLTGNSLDGNGFFVAAESTFTLGVANLTTDLNFENNDNVTHLLVSGFTGTLNQDLDTNDDSILDLTPWTSIDDGIVIVGPTGTQSIYYTETVGPEGPFHPGHVYRCSGRDGFTFGQFAPTGGDDTPGSASNPGRCLAGYVGATPTAAP